MDIITIYNELTTLQSIATKKCLETELNTVAPNYYPVLHAVLGSINELRKNIGGYLEKRGDELELKEKLIEQDVFFSKE